MKNERTIKQGMLSKDSSFRIVIKGRFGIKELERLVNHLKIDLEILANDEGQTNLPRELNRG